MGLFARQLLMRNFRSFSDRTVDFDDATTILVGRNATGKTNTIEALQMLTAGYSFRRPTPGQLINDKSDEARITLCLEGDGRIVDMTCDISSGKRRYNRNGKRCQATEMPGTLMSILFCPDDLALVKRGAAYRRDEIDDFGRQANVGYSKVLTAYARALEQRNRLLKEERPDLALLDAWDKSVAVGGATLLRARMRLFSRLTKKISDVYRQISGGEVLTCSYESSLGDNLTQLSRDELADVFVGSLLETRDVDLRRQQTTVGPHRDDIIFEIDGHDARVFGSQGQQRSVVLALKMSEVLLAAEILGEQPLLLLDDVMSELDEEHRESVLSFVYQGIQTVITTTNLGYFSKGFLGRSKVVSFDA